MKKLLFLIVLVTSVLYSQAQVTIYHDTVSRPIPKNGSIYIIKDSMINNTAAPINITWNVSNEVLLTGWSYAGICDIVTCYPYPVTGNKQFTLAPGQKAELYVDPKALVSAVDGNNYVTLRINDGVSDKYMTYHFYSWANQVSDLETNNIVSIYPNPLTNFININILDNKVSGINVLNIIGKKIAHFDIGATTPNPMRIPLDNINKGVYLMQFTDQNGKLLGVKRVTKQ